jgi:uncharacterized membrane protein
MNIPVDVLPSAWHWIALLAYIVLSVKVLRRTPWEWLLSQERQHAFLASAVLLLIVWHMMTRVYPGLDYHYLGATLLTLMFGWRIAYLIINLALIGAIFSGLNAWQSLPLNALLMGLLPALVSIGIYHLSERYLPHHFFVYVFVNAFFGAALTLLVVILCAATVMMLGGVYSLQELESEYFPFVPLMLFPEAFLTGMLIAIFVVMRPGWVVTFDDARYLHGK